MLSYCLRHKKDTESENPKVETTKNGRIMLSSNCAVCGSRKSRYIKEQEAKWILSSIGKIPLAALLLIQILTMGQLES